MIRKRVEALKADGPDSVPPRVLRECATEPAPVLGHLFCCYMTAKLFPALWRHALVHPIPERENLSNPSN